MTEKGILEVPTRIFEEFLEELGKDAQLTEAVVRLRKVLLEDKNPTEASIRAALLSDGSNS